MRVISRRMAVGLLVLVGATIAGATVLGPNKPSPEPFGPAGSALSTIDSEVEYESADRPVITLGDLDPPAAATHPAAPFEACTVAGRDDLPVEARPAEDPVRIPQQPAEGGTGCRLEFRAGPGVEAVLTITITWTATSGPPDPARHPGAQAARYAGRAGLERAATGPRGERVCLSLMPAGAGTVAVRVSNTRYPAVDSCTVTAAVLTAIAHKTP